MNLLCWRWYSEYHCLTNYWKYLYVTLCNYATSVPISSRYKSCFPGLIGSESRNSKSVAVWKWTTAGSEESSVSACYLWNSRHKFTANARNIFHTDDSWDVSDLWISATANAVSIFNSIRRQVQQLSQGMTEAKPQDRKHFVHFVRMRLLRAKHIADTKDY